MSYNIRKFPGREGVETTLSLMEGFNAKSGNLKNIRKLLSEYGEEYSNNGEFVVQANRIFNVMASKDVLGTVEFLSECLTYIDTESNYGLIIMKNIIEASQKIYSQQKYGAEESYYHNLALMALHPLLSYIRPHNPLLTRPIVDRVADLLLRYAEFTNDKSVSVNAASHAIDFVTDPERKELVAELLYIYCDKLKNEDPLLVVEKLPYAIDVLGEGHPKSLQSINLWQECIVQVDKESAVEAIRAQLESTDDSLFICALDKALIACNAKRPITTLTVV